jgi:exopolyphosphatase/guanosine-5'-triphosphate,3'-diphosphate pyrophosphatase
VLVRYVAAMDFGSNAIRGVIARYTPLGLDIKKKFRFPIRLGDDVFQSGVIPAEKIHNVIEMIRFFQQACAEYKVSRIYAVGTSALREAKNQDEFVERCLEATGLKVNVISGEAEAHWIWLGVKNALHIENHTCVLMDIGGGSIELSLNRYGKPIKIVSLPLGTLRLIEEAQSKKLKDNEYYWLVRKCCESKMRESLGLKQDSKIEFVVGTGGNLTSLLDLGARIFKKQHIPSVLNRKELFLLLKKLESMSSKQRQKVFNLRPDRADVIVPAGHLALLLLDITHCDEMIIPSVGLREGLLWSLVAPSKKR